MNINELFYFKTVECGKKEHHNHDNCYFHHYNGNDRRRLLIDVVNFVKRRRENDEEDLFYLSDLSMYTNQIGFETESESKINEKCHLSPCINSTEHKYHILNYKSTDCTLDRYSIGCTNDFCVGLHKPNDQSESNEGESLSLHKFTDIYLRLIKSKGKIKTKEITEILNILHRTTNKYIDSQTLLLFLSRLPHNTNTNKSKNIVIDSHVNLKKNNRSKMKAVSHLHEDRNAATSLNDNNNNKLLIDNSDYKLDSMCYSNSYTKIIAQQHCIKANIYDELKNIPILTKETIYSSIINTDEQIVYLSNSLPKKEELNQLIIAMLNSHNGVIIYGVDVNTNKVAGIKMNSKSRDLFRQTFNGEYKSILIEYENCIKYKFYGLDDPNRNQSLLVNPETKDLFCIIVFKIKKVKEKKIIFDPTNKAYTIKPKFLRKFLQNKEESIKISDIKLLNMKSYIEIMKEKLLNHYKKERKLGD